MENKRNINQQPSGIWYIENNMACRINWATNKTICIPVTDEILNEIEKQKVAEKELSKLLKINNYDNGIIGKLWAFLDEYINYISYESKLILLAKMKELEMVDGMNINNVTFLNSLCAYLSTNEMESFEDTLDQFFEFNLQNIREIATLDTSILSLALNIPETDFSEI